MPKLKYIAVFCVSLVLLGSMPRDMAAPIDVQYPLFLKILTFDRKLDERAGSEIVIGIVYQERVRSSWLVKDELLNVVKHSSIKRIRNLPVRAVPIALDGADDLDRQLVGKGIDMLYVSPLRAYDVRDIARVARANHVLTLTGVPDYVERGLSLGIGLSGESPEILVNLDAARLEGADLHASLLRLARLVEDAR